MLSACCLLSTIGSSAVSRASGQAIQVRVERFTVTTDSGRDVEVTLHVPTSEIHSRRYPAFIVLGGFESAPRVLSMLSPKIPMVLASFDYPYDGPRRFGPLKALFLAKKMRRGVADTEDAILKTVSLLRVHPNVDRERLAIVGASFGTPFAIRGAAETEDVRALIIVHGFSDVKRTVQHRLTQIWEARLKGLSRIAASFASRLIVSVLDPPEPRDDARRLRASQQVLVVDARSDDFIPIESKRELWNALAHSKAHVARVEMDGNHLRPGALEQIAQIMSIAVDELGRIGWFAGSK